MKELVIAFHKKIKSLDEIEYLENYLKYQLAPVISGVKPSATLTLSTSNGMKEKWYENKNEMLLRLGLESKELRCSEGSSIILFYKKELIEPILEDDSNYIFLKNLNYCCESVEKAINCLVERYKEYHCPDELGLFLGIPLQDVKDFNDCSHKKCLLCGYWKVYNNVEEAKKKFGQYNHAKYRMLTILLKDL